MPQFQSPPHGAMRQASAAVAPAAAAAPDNAIVPDRAEFIDALARLRRGELLVHSDDPCDERCVIEGRVLYTSWKPLSDFGLLAELPRQGRVRCFRLSPRGRDFAARACAAWKNTPLWQRLTVRITG